MRLRGAHAGALLVGLLACSRPSTVAPGAKARCASLDSARCDRAHALLAATSDYGVVAGPFLIDGPTPRVVGRGIARDAHGGSWIDSGLACAAPTRALAAPTADRARVDHAFIAFILDDAIVPFDEPLASRLDARDGAAHHVRLAAVALARDLDPPFFDATTFVTIAKTPCACGAASHVVSGVRLGAMLAYDVDAHALDRRVPLADAFRAALVDPHAGVHEARTGDLVLDGLGRARTIAFSIRALAPIAHGVTPVTDLCPNALAAPEIVPAPLDFGEAAYGREVARVAHVVNRGPIGIRALRGADTIVIAPRSSLELPLSWTPSGDAFGCETQTRDETIVFLPDGDRATSPEQRPVVIRERIRTGRETITDVDHVDTTGRRKADFEQATNHDVACPPDFAVASCRAERRVCSDASHACSGEGYEAVAVVKGNGCHFACKGPGADPRAFCRFEAVTECRLACSAPGK